MVQNKRVLGVIPARGGSKGIKRKNLALLGDQPLIKYSIDACFGSKYLTRWMVSTDDQEIADYAEAQKAWVPFLRPAELATDIADSKDVVLHALDYANSTGEYYDYVMLLQPTTPFRSAEMIDLAIARLVDSGADALVSLIDVGANHPHRMYSINGDNEMKPLIETENPMLARQHLPKYYIRSGDIYLVKTDVFVMHNTMLPNKTIGLVIDEKNHVNIDTATDLRLANIVVLDK